MFMIDNFDSKTFKNAIPTLSFKFTQGIESKPIMGLSSLNDLNEFSMVFVSVASPEILNKISTSSVSLVILRSLDLEMFQDFENIKPSLLFVDSPRDVFAELAHEFGFAGESYSMKELKGDQYGNYHSSVKIQSNAWVGQNVLIGEGTKIFSGAFVADNSVIGKNVVLGPNSSVGYRGFGFAKSDSGRRILFPHIGKVILKDEVEIGANSTVDSGALGDTIIGFATKLDNLVHVGHNCIIGDEVTLAAGVILCGGVRIENGAWIAPNACVLNNVIIGERAMVGLGATVIRNVERGGKVAGNPARKLP